MAGCRGFRGVSFGPALAAMVVVAAAACWSGVGTERSGDEAYGAGRYREALAAYQQAAKSSPDARLWAKVGATALRAGDLAAAVEAYLRLAGEDPTRTDEAVQGLELAARAAERAGDGRALQAAVAGLQVVAPDRVNGRLALALARQPGSDAADLARFMPAAIAAATDPRMVDSLLTRYATALWETSGCGAALPVYQAVLRRSHDPALLRTANEGAAECTDTLEAAAADSAFAADSTW